MRLAYFAAVESEHPQLSVVLSTLGNYAVLERVLDGYDRQDAPPGSFEMLVVADLKEPDPTAVDRAIGERSFPVRRLTGHVAGLSANRNTGWRAGRAPGGVFTHKDTIPLEALLSRPPPPPPPHPRPPGPPPRPPPSAQGPEGTPLIR